MAAGSIGAPVPAIGGAGARTGLTLCTGRLTSGGDGEHRGYPPAHAALADGRFCQALRRLPAEGRFPRALRPPAPVAGRRPDLRTSPLLGRAAASARSGATRRRRPPVGGMSIGMARHARSLSRARRLLRGAALQPVRASGSRTHSADEVVRHCPACGGQVRFAAAASPFFRCGHCETPLISAVGELDVEAAVQARLYRAVSSVIGGAAPREDGDG